MCLINAVTILIAGNCACVGMRDSISMCVKQCEPRSHHSYTMRVAIKYYAKLIPTHSEVNLPLNVTYKVLRSPQLTY